LANVKITDLTAASLPLAGTELLEIVQSAASRKVAASDIAASATNVRTVATGGTGAATLTGYVKGNGTSAFTAAATVPFADLAGRAFAQPSSLTDQTGNVAAATAVTFDTDLTGTGISVVASTQITVAAAGTYMLSPSIQFKNTDAADHETGQETERARSQIHTEGVRGSEAGRRRENVASREVRWISNVRGAR
jgi:hypothetical protein